MKDSFSYEKQLNNATFLEDMGENEKAVNEYKDSLKYLNLSTVNGKESYSRISYKISVLSKDKNYFDEIMFAIFAKKYAYQNKDVDNLYKKAKESANPYIFSKLNKISNYDSYLKLKKQIIKHSCKVEQSFYEKENIYFYIFLSLFFTICMSLFKTDIVVLFWILSILTFLPAIYFGKKFLIKTRDIEKFFRGALGFKHFIVYLIKKWLCIGSLIGGTILFVYFFAAGFLGKEISNIENATLRNQNKTAVFIRTILTLEKDTIPPRIIGNNFSVKKGEKVDFKHKIKIFDNSGKEGLKVSINTGNLDINREGTYQIFYTVSDASGNVATKEIEVNVKDYSKVNLKNRITKLAKEVLSNIIDDNMTPYEKAEKIFCWTHDNITYKEIHDKNSPLRNAEMGFLDKQGDCYVFAYTAKELLTDAGIDNMIIERKKGVRNADHLWLIINIGEGWYHFDCMNGRADKSVFFYKKTEDLLNYNSYHPGYYVYDASLYPPIN